MCGLTTDASKTYRLVTDSNGTVEASSVLLSAADAADMLAAEVLIHRLAGWRVSVSGEGLEVAISAERGESRRLITVEERGGVDAPPLGPINADEATTRRWNRLRDEYRNGRFWPEEGREENGR